MKCESVREQLIDLLSGTLEPERRSGVERHLAECPECAAERRELSEVWSGLSALDGEHAPPVPSAALRDRFYRALDDYRRLQVEPSPWRGWLGRWIRPGAAELQPAWSLPALILGIALGASLMWAMSTRNEVERLTAEVESIRRTVSLSLLEHPSASERLRGVSWSAYTPTDDRIVEALLGSVRNDPNVNVRLVALEALARHVDQPRVRAGLIETLPRQQSPILQVALAEVLNQPNRGATEAIRQFLERDDLDPAVRDQIESLLESV